MDDQGGAMARIFKGVSIVIHATVIGAISYVQLFDPGLIPNPQAALAYEMPIEIRRDIPLPPAPMRQRRPVLDDRRNLAPIVEPNQLVAESPHDAMPSNPGLVAEGGIDGWNGDAPNIGIVRNVEPPPAPPAPPSPTKGPLPVGRDIKRPIKIINVDPEYPEIARAVRREGVVILEVVMATDGRVDSVRVLRGVPMLDQAAVAAVRLWPFEPARLNGQVVPVVMTVTVNFQLAK
jgi:protein TonB